MAEPRVSFRAHAFGNDLSTPCLEETVVKMIVEMLLGSTNDLFVHQRTCVSDMFRASNRSSSVSIDVYHLTLYGSTINLNGLSRSLMTRTLSWFAQFGSYVHLCRTFAYSRRERGGDTSSINFAVVETMQATMADLLTAVSEALCNLEAVILDLPSKPTHANSGAHFQQKITIISLYQQCYRLEGLFSSLAGLVCSITSSVLGDTDTRNGSAAVTSCEPQLDSSSSDCTDAVQHMCEQLAVRGVMQELNRTLQVGALLEIPAVVDFTTSRRGQPPAVKVPMVPAGTCPSTLATQQQRSSDHQDMCAEHKHGYHDTVSVDEPCSSEDECINSSTQKALVLVLPPPGPSALHQFAKLLLVAMCEKYLLNLTAMVWQQGDSSSSKGQNSARFSPATARSSNKESAESLALSRLLAVISAPLQSTTTQSAVQGEQGRVEKGRGLTLAQRKRVREQVRFLRQLQSLWTTDADCTTPTFLATITAEARVSAADVAVLQRSHVQRQNPSYNYSRLRVLVNEAVKAFHTTLAPAAIHSEDLENAQSFGTHPIEAYLATGRSVKIVGIRTQTVFSEKNETIVEKAGHPADLLSGVASQAKGDNGVETGSGGEQELGFMSNARYLQELRAKPALLSTLAPQSVTNGAAGAGRDADSSGGEGKSEGKDEGKSEHIDAVGHLNAPDLLQYVHHRARCELRLLSTLSNQLHQARADCAAYVTSKFALLANLRYLRDVYFLGQPDLYASLRERCLAITMLNNTNTDGSNDHVRQPSGEYVSDILDAVGAAVREALPSVGVRHVSVDVAGPQAGGRWDRQEIRSPVPASAKGTGVKEVTAALREALQPLGFGGDRAARSSTTTATALITSSASQVAEVQLLQLVASLTITPVHQWPLTQFFTAAHTDALNAQLRFLLLLAACRWTAEYYWMDVISNDSLGTAASGKGKAKRLAPYLRTAGSDSGGGSDGGVGGVVSSGGVSENDYREDVLQAKRNCRAGLGVWLHTVTAVSNIFMGHIHRTAWPAFETTLAAQAQSLLLMHGAFAQLLSDVSDSLLLLREAILEVVVRGFAATRAMREAATLEQAEKLAALVVVAGAGRRSGSDGGGGGGRGSGGNTIGATKREPGTAGGNIHSTSTQATVGPSARVFIAYRLAEEAFAALTKAVADLRQVAVLTQRYRAERGLNERQDRALSELQIALTH